MGLDGLDGPAVGRFNSGYPPEAALAGKLYDLRRVAAGHRYLASRPSPHCLQFDPELLRQCRLPAWAENAASEYGDVARREAFFAIGESTRHFTPQVLWLKQMVKERGQVGEDVHGGLSPLEGVVLRGIGVHGGV
jgi:hypothetical protein